MSETLASAVAVPEQTTLQSAPEPTTKRRKSSITEHDSKRRRLSTEAGDNTSYSERRRLSSQELAPDRPPPERKPSRQGAGRDEERKRGQRLFGGLLGTLSQSSTSAAQRRRADIEKKQQEKLKSQAEEYGELKKQKREQRDAIRKKEHPLYEREAMRTRHANMLAMAHSLKTRTKPVLYYKPWQLRRRDEAVIREQIEDAEATVAREVAEFDARFPPETTRSDTSRRNSKEEVLKVEGPSHSSGNEQQNGPSHEKSVLESEAQSNEAPSLSSEAPKTVGGDGAQDQGSGSAKPDDTPMNGSATVHDHIDVHRGADDDGGEVVEDNEDTVIY
ncbi:hypothetical protein N7474_007768 [Penicillium riverlandense]|uniref:uncharacterized protein n=1 Tax=Penicillium riverlandense TaxID=1903569 RepID=UPI002548B004|nr:uncharacterized protein N7474_007768 [Penicillium riverlandense]KAJ5811467.1 hypothetical protein N7474_007768 [Penicillium riverlandense]